MNKQISTGAGIAAVVVVAIVVGAIIYFAFMPQVQPPTQTVSNPRVNSMQGQIKNQAPAQNAQANATSQKQPVSDWKTYENKTYKFKLQYPSNYKFLETKISGSPQFDLQGISVFGLQLGEKVGEGFDPAYVSVFKNFSQKEPLREPAGADPASSTDTTIGDLKAKKYDLGDSVVYVVATKNFRYEIGYVEVTSATEKANFPKILQSIQFEN